MRILSQQKKSSEDLSKKEVLRMWPLLSQNRGLNPHPLKSACCCEVQSTVLATAGLLVKQHVKSVRDTGL